MTTDINLLASNFFEKGIPCGNTPYMVRDWEIPCHFP